MPGYAALFDTAYLVDQSAATAIGLGAAVNGVRRLAAGASPWVQCRMGTAAATCVVYVVLHSNEAGTAPIGVLTQTATATPLRDLVGSGDYWSQSLKFDAANAPFYEVRIAAPSAGTVDVYTWST